LLNWKDYVRTFEETQAKVVELTELVASEVMPGMSETEIADRLQRGLDALGLPDSWYPIIICAGEYSGQPISRRYHLPSKDAIVRRHDIVVVDCTPIKETVWWNWSKTVPIGEDSFFRDLCEIGDQIAQRTLEYGQKSARTVGDLFDYCMEQIAQSGLVLLDSRNDVGHSIFQVEPGQKVEDAPLESRLFISEEYRDTALSGIISIEPQVGRRHPADGIMYGAKQQRILIR
jgi:Xaa-Pro aminopeptidase